MMKKGKKFNILAEPLLHVVVAVTGLLLIIFLPDADSVCVNYRRLVSIFLDIGIGLLPTGLIGLTLVFLQKNQKNNEKFDQRISLLKELDLHLLNLLNEICRNTVGLQKYSNQNVKKTFAQLSNVDLQLSFSDELKQRTLQFSNEIDRFLHKKQDYLLTEMFSAEEIEALSLLSMNAKDFIHSFELGPVQAERNTKNMMLCILKILKKVPEFSPYLKKVFNGNFLQ